MSMNLVDSPLSEFESPWSIIEKIKKSNFVNSRQVLQRFGPALPITGGSISPFHLCSLENECPSCKKPIPYLLPRHEYESGFICSCGESLSNQNTHNQLETEPILKDSNVIAWLNLTEDSVQLLQKSVIFKPFMESNTNFMQHMLHLLDENSNGIYYSSIYDLNNNATHKDTVEMNFKEIYWSLSRTLKAFEKELLSTTLNKHQHCIKRFVGMYKGKEEKFPCICPYAYAYVFWKESLYNINPFVDEGRKFSQKNLSI